ncbi:MAG: ABC transporter ATP-binding protein, partial [Bacteroidetes bacterium]|nr:ABC transporter ATP-binding protein [Bacteroidota bacterium]
TVKGESDIVWSLKDLNFEVGQGDAVGVIGRNGAGKSTLLKILSRVTSPTTGSVKIKGRIASLLEVGTGFHPELTGRENIFLNGAILGMRKAEIKRKFDEIVDFSGVERYIDTPVKRYSSGMYVRLAFAVAAHLESEILIIDEVLAVGDAEFQRKCLGKMGDVSKQEGRTVLFVSHNMTSISNLCNTGILLSNGVIEMTGGTREVVDAYAKNNLRLGASREWLSAGGRPGNHIVSLLSVRTINESRVPAGIFDSTERIGIEISYRVLEEGHVLWHGINFFTDDGLNIFDSHSVTSPWYDRPHPKGDYKTIAWLPGNLLNEGRVTINVAIFNHTQHQIHLHEKEVIAFEIA